MTVHFLKTHEPYWRASERGEKPFEVRRDDRGFQKGDTLVLVLQTGDYHADKAAMYYAEFPERREASDTPPQTLKRRVIWILTGGQFGIEAGHVVMAVVPHDAG